MKILFLSKASTKIGFGHLIRSKTLANGFAEINKDLEIDFITVGDDSVQKMLVSSPFFVKVFSTENEIQITKNYDLVFFDMMEISDKKFNEIKKRSKLLISLSPIFNKQPEVDVLFHRTKYIDDVDLPEKVYAGLNFSIIQKDCKKIGAGLYEDNLNSSSFPVAISMGGGDAPNKTLRVLKSLKKCKVPATFWVMLGEGYQYSYDDLVNETKTDTNHEIILSNTNKSMWQILKNCLTLLLIYFYFLRFSFYHINFCNI